MMTLSWRTPMAAARVLAASAVVLAGAVPAAADVRDFLGRPVADVRVVLGGTPFDDPTVLQLVETRIGEPLSMQHVRETIDHLVGVGRFEDIRVFAQEVDAPAHGVVVTWQLVPVRRIEALEFTGRPVFHANRLREVVSERVGATPVTGRADEIVGALADYYRTRGYRRAAVQPTVAHGARPEEVTLTLAIDPGPRTIIDDVVVRGDAGLPPAQLRRQLELAPGRPFDQPALDERLARFEDELRDLGYYEATVEVTARFSDDETRAALTVAVDRGPRVRVVFEGDPLPDNRRETLVPIRRERSLDLDLLEDASRNIEAYLRQQGYRSAAAPYVRQASDDELVLTFRVSRGALHRLASIEVSGNDSLPLADITPLLPLERGEPFVDSRVATVAAAVGELYRVRGFVRVAVRPEVSVLPERIDDGQPYRPVAVRLVVSEGARTMVRAVAIEGVEAITEARVRDLLTLTAGRPFYRPLLDSDRDAIERLYRNEGFQQAHVAARTVLGEEGREVDVRWSVREGPRTLVDRVLISGNVRTSADLIRREVTLRPGEPLGEEAVIESQRRLASLGLFRRVRIVELPHGASTRRDVLIEIEEAPATTVSYGGGLEAGRRLRRADEGGVAEDRIEVAPRGFFEVTRRNLYGKNRSVSLFTRVSFRPRDPAVDSTDPTDRGGYGFNEYRVVGTFREPRPFNAPGDFQLTGFLEQAIRSSFNFRRLGVRTEYARRLAETLTVSGRYALDTTRLFDEQIRPEDQLLIDRLFPQVRLSTFTGAVLRDSRDDVLDPSRGNVLGVDGTLAVRALGSEVGFVKSFFQGFVYRRLPGATRLTLAAGGRLGLAVGFERIVERQTADGVPIVEIVSDVPASERFFAGGDTTVRGFVLDRLGTLDTLNDEGFPTGGGGLAVVNLELRGPYWKGLGAVGFFDAGNVFKRAGDIDVSELRPTAGFGLRYRSPLGPLRVDLGFNLDRRTLASGARERGSVFHISLGQAF